MNGHVTTEPVPSSTWIIGFCSVLFDIDKGQTLQHLHPVGCLSDEEQAAAAFHAFPDSLSMELHTRNAIKDSSFHFRIKRQPLRSPGGLPEYLHGYVFCRQRQDETLRRGGEQAAVVVLSELPLSCVLLPLSQVAGHAFFSEGPVALQQLYSQVCSWPAPAPGSHVSLSAGQAIIAARVPHFTLLPPPQPTVDPAVQVLLARRASRCVSLRRGLSSTSNLSRCSSVSSSSSNLPAAAAAAVNLQDQPEITPATPVGTVAAAAAAAAAAGGQHVDKETTDSSSSSIGASLQHDANGSDLCSHNLAHNNHSSSSSSSVTVSPAGSGSWSLIGTGAAAAAAAAAAETPRAGSRLQYSSRQDSSGLIDTPTAAAAAAAAPGSSSSAGDGCAKWISSALGQQWSLETPFPEVDIAEVLQPLLRHLWTLWQLLLTGQPLMVVGLTPRDTSVAIAALLCLIAPLPYAADYRPYFTIHDPDYIPISRGRLPTRRMYYEQAAAAAADSLTPTHQQTDNRQTPQQQIDSCGTSGQAGLQQPPLYNSTGSCQSSTAAAAAGQQQQQQGPDIPALLGVTNLYFIKALPAFPNVVAVSKKEAAATHSRPHSFGARSSSSSSTQLDALAAQSAASASAAEPPAAAAAAAAPRRGLISSTAAAAVRALKRRHQGPQHLLSEFSHHLWCARKPLVKPDYQVIAAVTAAMEKDSTAAAAAAAAGRAHRILKQHFAQLTAAFLTPFVRYFEPGENGTVPCWCPEAFLSSLEACPPVLTARLSSSSAAATLYGEFIESPNFEFWFKQLRQPVMHLVEKKESQQQQQQQQEEGYQDNVDALALPSKNEAAKVIPVNKALTAAVAAAAAPAAVESHVAQPLDEVSLVQALLSAEQELAAAFEPQQQQQQQQRETLGPGEVLFPAADKQQQQQQQQRLSQLLQQQQHKQHCSDESVEQQLTTLALQIRLVSAFAALPHDLQTAMISNPDRRQLLTESLAALAVGDGQSGAACGDVPDSGCDSNKAAGLQQLRQLIEDAESVS